MFICSVTHNIEKYTPMNSSPVLLLLGFLEAQTSKRSARKFFSRHFSVQISEWASFISFTHLCASHNFEYRTRISISPDEQTERPQFFSGHFPSEFQSGLPTQAYLCLASPTFVSHTIWCLTFSTFVSLYGQTKHPQFFFLDLFPSEFQSGRPT